MKKTKGTWLVWAMDTTLLLGMIFAYHPISTTFLPVVSTIYNVYNTIAFVILAMITIVMALFPKDITLTFKNKMTDTNTTEISLKPYSKIGLIFNFFMNVAIFYFADRTGLEYVKNITFLSLATSYVFLYELSKFMRNAFPEVYAPVKDISTEEILRNTLHRFGLKDYTIEIEDTSPDSEYSVSNAMFTIFTVKFIKPNFSTRRLINKWQKFLKGKLSISTVVEVQYNDRYSMIR